MKRLILYAALPLVLCACGNDPAPKRTSNNGDANNGATNNGATNNGASNNGSTNNGSTNNGSTNNGGPNNGTANNGVTCDGCLDGATCVDGSSPDACGGGGEACSVCSDGWLCADGECIAPPTCDSTNCEGCCDASGQCRSGDNEAACGSVGMACATCEGTESCLAGACTKPCAETCGGCCDGETCLAGNTDGSCGANGAACMNCGVGSACDDSGQCVATSCSDSCAGCCSGMTCEPGNTAAACGSGGESCEACGTNRTCSAGGCVVDPASRWEFVLVSGEVPTVDEQGQPWDVIGLPDPVVNFEVTDPGTGVAYRATSSIAQDDATPTWNESLVTNVPAAAFQMITFDIADSDFDLDDPICAVIADVSDPAQFQALFDGATYSVDCVNGSLQARIDFRLQPN